MFGAGGGTRTLTPSLAPDFESGTSTSSITPACLRGRIIHEAASHINYFNTMSISRSWLAKKREL